MGLLRWEGLRQTKNVPVYGRPEMPELCSCGAQLPPDAYFCHKCGKPQRELLPEPEVTPELEPEPEVSYSPLPHAGSPALNFHNPVAVRVGLSMASAAALLSWLPLLNYGGLVWLFAAGFVSVFLYHRRTGQSLTVKAGARLGWITGILSFALITVLFTTTMIALANAKGGLAGIYQEQLRSMPVGDPNVAEALKLFQTPAGLASIIVFTLAVFFVIVTTLCTAGGALGAKLARKN